MQATRKDIGYTIYSRLEESIRLWIREKLLNLFGNEWHSHIPGGVWDKAQEKSSFMSLEEVDDPVILLDETGIPDLKEIVCYKKAFHSFVPQGLMKAEEFRVKMTKLHETRCKIAHVKRNFSAIDLDLLIDIAGSFLPIIGTSERALQEALDCVKTNPEKLVVQIPPSFFVYEEQPSFAHVTNLPRGDYDPDGGFIGRKEDLSKVSKLLLGGIHRVVTISGAGGVGKTAIAHQICQNLLDKPDLPFDAIVWVSAKEEKLTVTGIEPIEPILRNYETVLGSILETFAWQDELNKPVEQKEESVDIILRAGNKGILLVVDNLETIRDERVIEFIKDFPPPSKVLITSRLGLGEVERRYPLKEMNTGDSVTLLRTIAREKGVQRLAELPDNILSKYVQKMSRYPLAIKWVVGQVALGKDMNLAIGALTSSTGDVAKFCFERIFDTFLNDDARIVLYALAANDRALVRGVLSHVSNLLPQQLDTALRSLTVASLVVPAHFKSSDTSIETRYELLPLTRNYIQSRLQSHPEIYRDIKNRTEMVQNLIEEADKAGRQYRYSLRDMGAESEAEKVAATWAFTAYQKYQADDYDGSVEAFKKAAQIAPNFPAVYRNWATMESDAGFYQKADELMRKATSLDSNDSRLWFVWGNIEKRRRRYDRAYRYLKSALNLSPDDAPILGALGEVEKRRGNFEEADGLLRKALTGSFSVSHRRHEIICHTALADNLRRWAQLLSKDRQPEGALNKLKEAFRSASKAIELGKDDIRAKNAYLAVSKDLAVLLLRLEGVDSAMPYFDSAITQKPKRWKERKINEGCCFYLAQALLRSERSDVAKKYFNLGKKALFSDSKFFGKYKELGAEFSQQRSKGKLYRVFPNHGYGFIELEGETGQTIFLHISEVLPKVSSEEFEDMKGSTLSFIVEQTEKGPQAKAARFAKE